MTTNTDATRGFQLSYRAGRRDAAGRYLGGTEIIHLTAHGGRLYAATGMWMDEAGDDPRPGPQILALDRPGSDWRLEHEFAPTTLRITALASVTFTTDGAGRTLDTPVSMLLAAPGADGPEATVFSRDDATGDWTATALNSSHGPVLVRSLLLHRDRVTGVDRVLAGCSPAGIVSGVYDSSAPGRIRWDARAEFRQAEKRVMSLAECGGVVYAVAATTMVSRVDGLCPQWTPVYASSIAVDNPKNSGLRALAAIANPSGAGDVLLAALEGTHGRVLRLDPAAGFREHTELDVNAFLRERWETPIRYTITAYNDMPAVTDPRSGETVRLLGLEANYGADVATRPNLRGWEGGAWYLIRRGAGQYELRQIVDPFLAPAMLLIATRTIVVSPFAQDAGQALYFGGYDANFIPAHNSAWIIRADLAAAV